MATKKKSDLSGRQKVAIILISLGHEGAAEIYKQFTEDETEKVTLEIAKMQKVEASVRKKVIDEFAELLAACQSVSSGGMKYANEILKRAFGQDKAMSIIGKLTSVFQVRPFDIVRTADPDQLINFIQNEHPQTIALIMAHLSPQQGSQILSNLPENIQTEVAKKLALMDRTSPEIIREIERVLEKKLSIIMGEDYTAAGGVEAVVDILNHVDRGTEKTIIETLEIQDPELAEEIKKLMFVFDDLVSIDDRGIQRLLREVDMKELAVALKGASDEVREKLFSNMSKRAAAMLKEDMDFMGPVRVRDVDEAQTKIVNIIRSLAENNEIVISRGGEEEMLV